MQKAVVVSGYWDEDEGWIDSSEELNEYLLQGYKVVSATPMGAYGYGYGASLESSEAESDHGFASLVIIDKSY